MNLNGIVNPLSKLIEEKIPEEYLIKFQDILLSGGIFTMASQLLAIIAISVMEMSIFMVLFSFYFSFDILVSIILGIIIPPGILISFIIINTEKRNNQIERAIPDFLRQLSTMLSVGLSFENALSDLSKYGFGPLYEELRRTVIEIKIGREFDDAIVSMGIRLKSENLKRTLKIILEAKKSGGGLADIIEDVSHDFRSMLALKRERRSSVMMAIMFLIISAVIAAPFALGMIGIYSSFMEDLGRGNMLIGTSKIAAGSYIIIHSILVGFMIGLIMYGDFKKGIKFSIPLSIVAYSIFYLISNFGVTFLAIT